MSLPLGFKSVGQVHRRESLGTLLSQSYNVSKLSKILLYAYRCRTISSFVCSSAGTQFYLKNIYFLIGIGLFGVLSLILLILLSFFNAKNCHHTVVVSDSRSLQKK